MVEKSHAQTKVGIQLKTSTETTEFAAAELAKYLGRIFDHEQMVVLEQAPTSGLPLVRLGLFTDFPEVNPPEILDEMWNDAVYIQVKQGEGVIAGNNPRSLLLAVYRFLNEVGCRWVRPGQDGELIPRRNPADLTVTVSERAAYRHRGLCIEGAVSAENVQAVIDWLPKVGMNSYFIQFREGFTFFQRWYDHKHNPQKPPAGLTREQALAIVRSLEKEIRRRGLLYHAVGHGWTCEPLGIPGLGWDQPIPKEASAENTPFLAQVNGKRQIWQGIPLNTNLCYSNPAVRQLIVREIVQYLTDHPGIDLLHFWLADGQNNQCECSACAQGRPADFYLQMLNELDEQLTAARLQTRIVFLIYVDLLWPPEKEQIKNPERFLLMFAPITRSYTQSFPNQTVEQTLPPYVRNHLEFPSGIRENLAHLRAWQQVFSGDAFAFDYHLMWAHYFDPGYIKIAEIAAQDIKNLRVHGLNGYISCQVQRAFLPTGLPMKAIAGALWDPTRSFNELATKYFTDAFGPDGAQCYRLLAQLPNFMDELDPWARQYPAIGNPEIMEKLGQINQTLSALKLLVEANQNTTNQCHRQSWKYLGLSLEISAQLTTILRHWFRGQTEMASSLWTELKAFTCRVEDEVQIVFDVFEFIETIERAFNGLKQVN